MEKIRRNNVLSLIINLSMVFFTIQSVYYSFRTDVIRDPEWFGFEGIHSLRFFTVLSNIFVAVAAAIMLIYNIKNLVRDTNEYPRWLITLKHMATTAVALTFVTVVLLLSPTFAIMGKGYFTLLIGNHIYMHVFTPLIAIVSFIFFENTHHITFKKSLLALIPVGLYAILYMTMVIFVGEENGGWMDFYNFTFGGQNYLIPISAIGMMLVTLLLAFLLAKWHNRHITSEE